MARRLELQPIANDATETRHLRQGGQGPRVSGRCSFLSPSRDIGGADPLSDYAHLAITFCRCMNIPARYCTGYLGDIGIAPPYGPMDFAAWFEAYLGGRWYTFDPRNNVPRIGRVLIAEGRDAADVPITHTFWPEHAGQLQGLDGRGLLDPSPHCTSGGRRFP
jgi:hypothetical protein